MATHTVIIDPAARSTTIQVSPNTALSDVLRQACTKRGFSPDQYALKYNNKLVDLSLVWRLANLPRGAKLDLVQASRSPSVVTVALQLPDNIRLTNKFASTTSLWQLLRVFEDKGDASKRLNLTQKETSPPSISSGSGRLYYAQPVLNFMGREFSTFLDLQKTLGQLGFGGGQSSLLLRISFRDTQQPLEQAMEEISKYFASLDASDSATSNAQGALAGSAGESRSAPNPAAATTTETVAGSSSGNEPSGIEENAGTPVSTTGEDPTTSAAFESPPSNNGPTSATVTTNAPNPDNPTDRPTTVFLPPSSSTPQAARTHFNEADYEPTVDHAKLHQSRLAAESRNKRLASTAELEQQEAARLARLESVSTVTVRVRLPDQATVETVVGQTDTAAALYTYVRGLLAHPDTPFVLRYIGPNARQTTLAEDDSRRLIRGLGFAGKMLLTLVWAPGARPSPGPVLREEIRDKARAMAVQEPAAVADAEGKAESSAAAGQGSDAGKGKEKPSAAEKENKLKGLLMKGFKKK